MNNICRANRNSGLLSLLISNSYRNLNWCEMSILDEAKDVWIFSRLPQSFKFVSNKTENMLM